MIHDSFRYSICNYKFAKAVFVDLIINHTFYHHIFTSLLKTRECTMPSADSTGPDPYKATREEFTKNLVDVSPPAGSAREYELLWNTLNRLMEKMAYHDAMKDNLRQTFMTPATSKNKVYFMWDFVGRTRGMMVNVDPKLSPQARGSQEWKDCLSRSALSQMLIKDKTGKLEMMNAATGYNDDAVSTLWRADI